jgi:dUTP pyrophosphatase
MEQIKQTVMVKVLNGEAMYMPVKLSEHASGADVRACLEMRVIIHPGGFAMIPLGIKMEPPEGYELQLRPRSGLASKGIMGSFGTIDADFRGEIHAILFNFSSDNFIIKNRDRIGQLVLAKMEPVEYVKVNFLTDTKRGAGGFGSTGG